MPGRAAQFPAQALLLLTRYRQFKHQRRTGEQHHRMGGHQRQQYHQPGTAVHQADHGNADHDGVGKGDGQCQHSRPPVQPLHHQRPEKQDGDSDKVCGHGLEVELLDAHLAGGAEQQCRSQQQEDQVGQILDGRSPYPLGLAGDKAGRNQQDHGEKGDKDELVHRTNLSARPPVPLQPKCF